MSCLMSLRIALVLSILPALICTPLGFKWLKKEGGINTEIYVQGEFILCCSF
jgi:hypothetical protein